MIVWVIDHLNAEQRRSLHLSELIRVFVCCDTCNEYGPGDYADGRGDAFARERVRGDAMRLGWTEVERGRFQCSACREKSTPPPRDLPPPGT